MSKGNYGDIVISAEERRRQLEEQKRRMEEERRRLEEAQKKEIERRRREEIAAEKERLALAKNFREKALNFQKQAVSGKNETRRPGRERPNLSAKKAEMQEQVLVMLNQLAAIPDGWMEYFAERLAPLREMILKVEASKFDTYYYNQLKEVGRNLAALVATAEKELENMFHRLKECKEASEKFLIEMEIIVETALLDEQRRRAQTIIAALRSLLKQSHPDLAEATLQNLRSASQQLWEEYTRSQEEVQQQRFLLQNAQEVLEEMGYRVLKMDLPTPDSAAAVQGAESTLYFRTHGQGLIEMSFGHGQSFATNYLLPRLAAAPAEEIPAAEIIADCYSWCRDYDIFAQRFFQRKIYLQEKGRQQPTEGYFKGIIVPETFFEEEELSAHWTKEEEKRF